jgi:hypothetical protein
MDDSTCASCVMGLHLIVSSLSDYENQAFGEQWIGLGSIVHWTVRSPDRNPLFFFFFFLSLGTPKGFGIFSADQWHRGFTATSIECLLRGSSETRNFRQSAHLCGTKSLKLCWSAWKPHRASAAENTRTSPLSQQALVSGQMLTGTFLLI